MILNKNILLLVFLSVVCSCSVSKKDELRINDFNKLQPEFANPGKDYRTAPLYVWNTKITPALIDSTMYDLKENGFGGVFIHPRPGMITEYLSDEWYALFNHMVSVAKELDMNVWIYDENSYPSGFAGGHVPALMPESYEQGTGLDMFQTDQLPDSASQYFVCLKETDGKFIDITGLTEREKGCKGNYYLFSKSYEARSPWYAGYSYVDLLHKGVTEKFIDITLGGYSRVAADEFGKTIKGWFTDEPGIKPVTGAIRWTPVLFDRFEKQWGYKLQNNLPSLFNETGEWKKVRHNYTKTLLDLFIDRWAKPSYEYCENNNLIFTGHYWEHGWPNMMHGGDNMAMYAWQHMPGIDMLFNRYNPTSVQAQFGNIRSVKELRSVANQMGRTRTLSETYGGGGWDVTFKDFKRLGDWEFALGVNFMNQHLSYMSITGARKYDYPPSFSYHSPWWKYYKELNNHFARLSVALSAGRQINDILVIEPTTSIWQHFSYGTYKNKADSIFRIGQCFQDFLSQLEKQQVEYDLGSENVIGHQGSIHGNKFIVGQCSYSTVIIPPMVSNIDSTTFLFLKKFALNGGKIVSYSQPTDMEGVYTKEVKAFFSDSDHLNIREYSSPLQVGEYISPDIQFINTEGKELFHQRRIMDDGQLLFLVNSSLDESSKGKIRIKGKDAAELNTFTGQYTGYTVSEESGFITFDYALPPAGSLLLYVFNEKKNIPSVKTGKEYVSTCLLQPSDSMLVCPSEMNVLTVDFCNLFLGNEVYNELHVYDATDSVFKAHDFTNGNPWNTSVQYKNNIICRDTFSSGGFKAEYKFTLALGVNRQGMQVVVEQPSLYKVSINGHTLQAIKNKWWLDRDMGVYSIENQVKDGENTIQVSVSPMSIYAEIEPVYISGNFLLEPAPKGWTIVPAAKELHVGSWKEQGWPFFSKTVSYSRKYTVSGKKECYEIVLGEWNGTVSEVLVNGISAGIIAFEPYALNISNLIREGENTIEVKITGSNKNLLGPHHNNPVSGITSPKNFRNIKKYPAGKEYQQFDYGLITDFQVIVKE